MRKIVSDTRSSRRAPRRARSPQRTPRPRRAERRRATAARRRPGPARRACGPRRTNEDRPRASSRRRHHVQPGAAPRREAAARSPRPPTAGASSTPRAPLHATKTSSPRPAMKTASTPSDAPRSAGPRAPALSDGVGQVVGARRRRHSRDAAPRAGLPARRVGAATRRAALVRGGADAVGRRPQNRTQMIISGNPRSSRRATRRARSPRRALQPRRPRTAASLGAVLEPLVQVVARPREHRIGRGPSGAEESVASADTPTQTRLR